MDKIFNQRWHKYEKIIEQKFGAKLEKLREIKYKILEKYKNTFSAKCITGDYDFWKILNNATIKEEEELFTSAEKCFRRNYDICNLEYRCKEESLKDELEEMEIFYEIINQILPLQTLWAMEYEKEDDLPFTEDEQIIYDYLKNISNFYLSTTDKYKKLYDESKQTKVKSI